MFDESCSTKVYPGGGTALYVAFGAVVNSFVKDLLSPLNAATIGKPNFSCLVLDLNGAKITYDEFLNALISFILVAGAGHFFVVLPVNARTLGKTLLTGPSEGILSPCVLLSL